MEIMFGLHYLSRSALIDIPLPCQAILSHGGRLSNVQKPLASAIIQKIHGGIF